MAAAPVTAFSLTVLVCAAVLCAVAAVRLAVHHERGLRRARLMLASGGATRGPVPGAPPWERLLPRLVERAREMPREWLCLPAAVPPSLLGDSVLPLIGGALAVPLVGRRLRAVARRRERERRADRVVALCGAVAGELRAGVQPLRALVTAAAFTGALGGAEPAVLAAARFGGDVPDVLRRAAEEPGAEGLAGLAACWRVSVDGGAGLAAGLDRLEAALRAERDQRESLRAQLTGAWATVAVLALLPLAALAMGWALGADPLRVLLHTPAGLGALAVGGLLEAAGLWWAARIVRAGEAS
ncbi:type II secretion system F family protein [Streptomyces sp. NPDC093085]|uniref:type II secretion system F family protein n=1 Tax=Streptomyces sp. NPDC093085 TaxID=3155068 RepID=UPI00342E66F4